MKRILIVEDDLLQVLFLKKALKFLGYEVIGSAIEGAPAIEMATELNPDIILMDIQLAGKLNGIETAGHILKKVDCFVIYITGNSDRDHIDQAKQTQPCTILSKPISGEILNDIIDSYYSTLA